MNDAQLDKKLKQGRDEARRFFDGLAFARCEANAAALKERGQARRSLARMRAYLAGAGVLVAAAACAVVILATGSPGAASQPQQTEAALPEQTVYLSDEKGYRMNYIPVDMPDPQDPGLMTVLWELQDDSASQMAYYSLFEAGDEAFPAMVLPFPGSDYDMLLIAARSSKADSLAYRLIGYSGGVLQNWWSQDGVPGGLVTVADGVPVERRAQDDAQAVTYIVPIQTTVPGSIALPVDSVHMSVGERLLLVGGGQDTVDARSQSGLMSRQLAEYGVSAAVFRAESAGRDVLSIGQSGSTLSVDIDE